MSGRFSALAHGIGSKKHAVSFFIQGSCCQRERGLRRVFFPGDKPIAVELKKKDADHKARALVAVHEGRIAHDPCSMAAAMRMMPAFVE